MENAKKEKFFTIRRLAVIGVLAAMVFVGNYLQIPVASSRIHLGNVFCALSGLLFGPWVGGLASGVGNMVYDLIDPRYMAEAWLTFLLKFFIGFLAGLIAHSGKKVSLPKDVLGAAAGSVAYVVLYVAKNTIKAVLAGSAWGAAFTATFLERGIPSLVNAVLAVVVSVLLVQLIRPALRKARILKEE